MKIALELNLVQPGREFLNYWSTGPGNDVIAQIKDGQLWVTEYNADGDALPLRQVSLVEFVHLVAASAQEGNEIPDGQ